MTKKAIRGFDHHCLFLEKSIGHGTHHYFMFFMMAQGQFSRQNLSENFTKCSSRKSVLVCILFVLHGLASSWNGSSTCYILLFWILFWFILDCNTVALHFKTRNSIFPWEITSKESCFRCRILDPPKKKYFRSIMTRGEIENHKSLLNIFEFFFRHEKYAQSLSKPHCVDHV